MPLKAFRIVTQPTRSAVDLIAKAWPDVQLRQIEVVTFATSRAQALRNFNDVGLRLTLGELTTYGSVTGATEPLNALAAVPLGAVVIRPTNASGTDYRELSKPEGIPG